MTEKKTVKKKTAKPKAAKEPEKTDLRIRMRMSLANEKAFEAGKVYHAPEDVPVETAKSWIASGAAEEDKSLDGPPETK